MLGNYVRELAPALIDNEEGCGHRARKKERKDSARAKKEEDEQVQETLRLVNTRKRDGMIEGG